MKKLLLVFLVLCTTISVAQDSYIQCGKIIDTNTVTNVVFVMKEGVVYKQ